MIGFTHAIIAIAIALILSLDAAFFVIGALLPDVDFLMNISHRGPLHSLLFAAIIYLVVRYRIGKRESMAIALGVFTHLILDSMTYMGIQLLFPLSDMFSFRLTSSSNEVANLSIIVASLVIWLNQGNITKNLSKFKSKNIRFGIYAIILLWIITLTFFGRIYYQRVEMNQLLSEPNIWDGKLVSLAGTICSDIEIRESSSGNKFQIFDLCYENDKIVVWKIDYIETSNLEISQNIQIEGTFTLDYVETSGPELNFIQGVQIIG